MTRLTAVLAGQLITLAGQWGYLFAFREAFERQTDTLKARPWPSLGWGFALACFWTLLGVAAFHLAALNQSPWIMMMLTVPMYLATAAGGAVCLSVLAAKLLRWDVRERPYLCVALGQCAAAFVGLAPYVGVPFVTLYACAGIGAVVLTEFSASHEGGDPPRLGYAGLACLIALTLAISFGLVRGGRRMSAEAANMGMPSSPPPPPNSALPR